MPKAPTLMIAVGLGRPHGDAQDEDGLDRERDNGGGDDSDIATEAIMSIVNHLKHSKASAVRDKVLASMRFYSNVGPYHGRKPEHRKQALEQEAQCIGSSAADLTRCSRSRMTCPEMDWGGTSPIRGQIRSVDQLDQHYK